VGNLEVEVGVIEGEAQNAQRQIEALVQQKRELETSWQVYCTTKYLILL
jgi:hypothetical protein